MGRGRNVQSSDVTQKTEREKEERRQKERNYA